jgi:hypothetical protein
MRGGVGAVERAEPDPATAAPRQADLAHPPPPTPPERKRRGREDSEKRVVGPTGFIFIFFNLIHVSPT